MPRRLLEHRLQIRLSPAMAHRAPPAHHRNVFAEGEVQTTRACNRMAGEALVLGHLVPPELLEALPADQEAVVGKPHAVGRDPDAVNALTHLAHRLHTELPSGSEGKRGNDGPGPDRLYRIAVGAEEVLLIRIEVRHAEVGFPTPALDSSAMRVSHKPLPARRVQALPTAGQRNGFLGKLVLIRRSPRLALLGPPGLSDL
mmetsp:Transcript_69774/g.151794  ORF Transcript_69774/g.151794 Transcript_69774/m.151794 type:complete len:200 (-) Transcript_69774:967-1566(-)